MADIHARISEFKHSYYATADGNSHGHFDHLRRIVFRKRDSRNSFKSLHRQSSWNVMQRCLYLNVKTQFSARNRPPCWICVSHSIFEEVARWKNCLKTLARIITLVFYSVRSFMFLRLARFHPPRVSYKALILAFATWLFERIRIEDKFGLPVDVRGSVQRGGFFGLPCRDFFLLLFI